MKKKTDSPLTAPVLKNGDMLAAVDLGSNSFHMVVAQQQLGQLRVIDRIREMVRMAEGLDARGNLDDKVADRAIACLARFGQRVRGIPATQVRALATNSVRALADPQAFLVRAEAALGHDIEVVSGREEARLVYLGVAQANPSRDNRLRMVMDIGGGSTETIIGRGLEPVERESLQVGCVATTRRFFPNGKLTRKKWRQGLIEVAAEFQQFANAYRQLGWSEAIGSSGTIKAIGKVCQAMALTNGEITPEALWALREEVLKCGHVNQIDLPDLNADRKPVIAGGILVLEAAFSALGIREMRVSKDAMREGILYDMAGRLGGVDPRELSIEALMQRYGIERAQAARVENTAVRLFRQVAKTWRLGPDELALLSWAARVHEIGLAVAHSQYQVHGAYILQNSDIAGFTYQEQQQLACLIRNQRRSISRSSLAAMPERLRLSTRRLVFLLRIAVLLHRSHDAEPIKRKKASAKGNVFTLELGRKWLEARPLLRTDLEGEHDDLKGLGIRLNVKVV